MTINQAFKAAQLNTWTEGAVVYYNYYDSLERIDVFDARQARVVRRHLIVERVADLVDLRADLRPAFYRFGKRHSLAESKQWLKDVTLEGN